MKNTFENIFPSFTSALFRLKKQTNKNVMDTTFDVFVKNSDVFQWDGKPGAKFFHTVRSQCYGGSKRHCKRQTIWT